MVYNCSCDRRTRSSTVARYPLELIHIDIQGLFREADVDGNFYQMILVVDYTRRKWLYRIKHKSNYPKKLKQWLALMGTAPHRMRSDFFQPGCEAWLSCRAARCVHSFLKCSTTGDIYIHLPPNYAEPGYMGLLKKSLYSTSSAPRSLNMLPHNWLQSNNFKVNRTRQHRTSSTAWAQLSMHVMSGCVEGPSTDRNAPQGESPHILPFTKKLQNSQK